MYLRWVRDFIIHITKILINSYKRVYCRVVKDWTSGESVYGSLNEGLVCHVTTSYCKSLLKPDCVLLNCLGRHLAFEIAIGLNGVVWVKAEECIHSIVLRNAIMNAEQLREDDSMIEAMVAKLAERLKKK